MCSFEFASLHCDSSANLLIAIAGWHGKRNQLPHAEGWVNFQLEAPLLPTPMVTNYMIVPAIHVRRLRLPYMVFKKNLNHFHGSPF